MSHLFIAKIPALPDWHALYIKSGADKRPIVGPSGEVEIIWVGIMFWGIRLPWDQTEPKFPGDMMAGVFSPFMGTHREPSFVPLDGSGNALEGDALLLLCQPGDTFEFALARWNQARDAREKRTR